MEKLNKEFERNKTNEDDLDMDIVKVALAYLSHTTSSTHTVTDVYKIVFQLNKSVNFAAYWKEHLSSDSKSCKMILDALEKYFYNGLSVDNCIDADKLHVKLKEEFENVVKLEE